MTIPLPRRPPVRPVAPASAADGLVGADLPALLGPLTEAQDALARLDAMVATAPEPIREGLIARVAFREAAGWLATAGCWVHPRDLALRAAHLIGPTELPNTAGHHWEDMDSTTRLLAEGHVATALALARFLRHLVRQPRLLADPDAALAALAPLTGAADPSRFAAWRVRWSGQSPTPALLTVVLAAADWMEAGITDCPSPLAALAAGAALLAAAGILHAIPPPLLGRRPGTRCRRSGPPAAAPERRHGAGLPGWSTRLARGLRDAGGRSCPFRPAGTRQAAARRRGRRRPDHGDRSARPAARCGRFRAAGAGRHRQKPRPASPHHLPGGAAAAHDSRQGRRRPGDHGAAEFPRIRHLTVAPSMVERGTGLALQPLGVLARPENTKDTHNPHCGWVGRIRHKPINDDVLIDNEASRSGMLVRPP
jgi:hypothetical protein